LRIKKTTIVGTALAFTFVIGATVAFAASGRAANATNDNTPEIQDKLETNKDLAVADTSGWYGAGSDADYIEDASITGQSAASDALNPSIGKSRIHPITGETVTGE
jgi:hypothetical protein